MAGFKLQKSGDSYDFDVFGPVKDKNGAVIGKWSTDKDNKIVVTKDVGSGLSFDAVWKFNSNNQLTISSAGQEVFNFHSGVNRPFYYTRDAVLYARPDQNNAFTFALRGEWDISPTHDLSITIGGVTSVIDGYVQDTRSRFMYHFFNKMDLTQQTVFGFVGEWSHVNDNGQPKLDFNYKREDGTSDTFSLPKSVTIDTTVNQFMYEYDKKGHKYRIQFAGFLKVSENFDITYDIDRQVSQSGQEQVTATSFTIKAQINKKAFSGNIEFQVKKTDGTTGSTTLSLRGNFTAIRGQTKLQVGFAFDQVRGPNNVVTTKFGFNGTLEWKGGKIQWSFDKNATKTTIAIAATDIKLGPARLDAVLNVTSENGQVAGIYFLLGIKF